MSYAVVYFLNDDVFSEVPLSWVNADQTECWWPPNNPKNVTNLIKMRASPKSDWIAHKVQLEGIYETLDKAVKKAGNSEYTSGDEVRGRGMRKKFAQYSSSESGGSLTPPPYINLREAEVIWEQQNRDVSSPDVTEILVNEQAVSLVNPSNLRKRDVTNVSTQTEYEHYETKLEEKIDILLTSVNLLTLRMEELNDKFRNVDVVREPTSKNFEFFLENLPCDSMESITKLDEYLEKEDHKNNFIKYLQTIGGAHPKDKVNRIMKVIMTNEFAISCSWLGLRNNIRASDFLCLKIAQSFASQSFIQGADFEKVAAEWIRLSSLRFKRQK